MYEAVVIGVSAGGLEALSILIPKLAAGFSLPVIIVQHRSGDSGTFLSEYLNERSAITVKEACGGEAIEPPAVYIAPAGYHLLIEEDRTFALSIDPPVNYSRPSIDVLFESAVDVFGEAVIGVILTGANSDGSKGLKAIKSAGGLAVVQAPESAEFDLMPRAALIFFRPQTRAVECKLWKRSMRAGPLMAPPRSSTVPHPYPGTYMRVPKG